MEEGPIPRADELHLTNFSGTKFSGVTDNNMLIFGLSHYWDSLLAEDGLVALLRPECVLLCIKVSGSFQALII